MDDPASRSPLQSLSELVHSADLAGIERLLADLPPGDVVRVVSRLDDDERTALFSLMSPASAAPLVEQLPEGQALDLMEDLEPDAAAAILGKLPSDEQADLLGGLEHDEAAAILAEMPPAEARDAEHLARYPPDVAGGLMVTEYLAYRRELTVGEVNRDIRTHAERYRDYQVQYAFVTDAGGRLVGVLRLRDLLLSRPDQRIGDLMLPDPLTVQDTDPLDDLRSFFERHPFYGVPVVDGDGRLVGIVRKASVQEALAERTGRDYLKSQGIVGGEELRTMPVLRRSGRRLSWLSLNILLNVIAASVIAVYQETLSAVIALAVFLPIISDMSGCSGNQAVAVSMRELTLGLVKPSESLRVWAKELSVGCLNGLALGALIGAVAWLWKGNPFLGVVVGGAMAANTVVAVSIGGTVPLVLRRFGLDPALASGPILTTVTDLCGFFLLLSMATALLPRLVG